MVLLEEKVDEIRPTAKNMQNDLTFEAELQNPGALQKSPSQPVPL